VSEGDSNSKLIRILAWTAGVAFAASWFLPVLEDVPGWMAFRYALAPLVPFRDAGTIAWDDSAPQVMSALTNVAFIILFGLWLSNQAVRPGLFVRIAIACFVLNLYWFVKAWRDGGIADLLFGYYVWLGAFALLLTVAALIASASRRTSTIPTAGTSS
jgi:DMSO/TMAO reductase YedYZ heme-binding membrane subunit